MLPVNMLYFLARMHSGFQTLTGCRAISLKNPVAIWDSFSTRRDMKLLFRSKEFGRARLGRAERRKRRIRHLQRLRTGSRQSQIFTMARTRRIAGLRQSSRKVAR